MSWKRLSALFSGLHRHGNAITGDNKAAWKRLNAHDGLIEGGDKKALSARSVKHGYGGGCAEGTKLAKFLKVTRKRSQAKMADKNRVCVTQRGPQK